LIFFGKKEERRSSRRGAKARGTRRDKREEVNHGGHGVSRRKRREGGRS